MVRVAISACAELFTHKKVNLKMDKNEWISRFDGLILEPSIRDFYGEKEFFNVGYWLPHTPNQQEASSNLMEKLLEFIPEKQ